MWIAGRVRVAEALFAAIVEPGGSSVDSSDVLFRIDGDRDDYLLFDWLNELLYRFDVHGQVLSGFEVSLDATGLSGRARSRAVDGAHDRLLHEVKAITYHGLNVSRSGTEWVAEIIVDI